MKTAVAMLTSTSIYSQGRVLQSDKLPKELPDDYEKRTWRERMWVTEDGRVFIPPMQFCNSLKEAAKYLNLQVPGGGKRTFTKNFEAGILVMERLPLNIKAEDVKPEKLYVPSDGRRGGTRRVYKYFPVILEWCGAVTYTIFDDIITEDVFRQVLDASGKLIGIGRFRPRNMGYYGTFKVDELIWQDENK